MKILEWIDHRLPVVTFFRKELKDYPTPKNLNYMWNFGSLSGITLVIMILSGVFICRRRILTSIRLPFSRWGKIRNASGRAGVALGGRMIFEARRK